MNVIALTKELIRIPSITDSKDESQPIERIGKFLRQHGITYQILGERTKQNLVAEIGKGEKSVLLNGHFDVVPAKKDMFVPKVREGKIFGRGAADAKGPLAALLCAFVALSQQELVGKVIFCAVSDEENAGEKGSKILAEQGIIGDYNIAGEPTGNNVIIAEKGFLRILIKISGKELHAAFPDNNSNAISLAAKVIEKLQYMKFQKTHTLLGKPTVSFGLISGGQKINIGAGYCELGLDIRYLPNQSQEEVLEQIRSILKPLCNFCVEIVNSGTPFETNKKSPLVRVAHTISKGTIQAVNFGTDARFYAPKDAIVFGPGESEIAHQESEYINIEELKKAVIFYQDIVRRLLTKKPL